MTIVINLMNNGERKYYEESCTQQQSYMCVKSVVRFKTTDHFLSQDAACAPMPCNNT